MDETRIYDMLQRLSEITFSIDKDIAELKVSIAALTAIAATQLNPADPEVGAQHVHDLEEVARKADPTSEQRQTIADVIDAVKLLRKHGSHEA